MKKVFSTVLFLLSLTIIVCILINQDIIKWQTPFSEQLITDIDNSDEIVIVEYNEELNDKDFSTLSDIIKSKNGFVQYQKISPSKKYEFRSMIKNLNNSTPTAVKACIFDPHHTIFFIKNNKIFSKMVICFNCELISYRRFSQTDINNDFFERLKVSFDKNHFNTKISYLGY